MAQHARPFIAGAVSAGAVLAVAELVAGLHPGVPSLLTSVGQGVIPYVPGAVERTAIRLFGTADKAVLTIGAGVVAVLLAGGLGVLEQRRRGVGPAGVAVLGAIGLVASLSVPGSQRVPVILTVGGACAVGVTLLRSLLRRAAPTAPGHAPDAPQLEGADADERHQAADGSDVRRRAFLRASVLVAGASAAAFWTGRSLLLRASRGVDATGVLKVSPSTAPVPPSARFTGVPGLTPIVVPNEDFYRIDTALIVPRVDAAGWRLRVHGMVDREVELTYDDLLEMSMVEEYVTLACVSNEVGDDLVGNARWLGVALRDVLDLAGVHDQATQLVGRAVDGWTAGFPTELATDGRAALVALGMNGEPLPREHGFPARLIVPGLYGYVSATKWLEEIELTTWAGFDAYWIPRGWAKEGPIKTQSRIDVPSDGQLVETDTVAAGVAWAGRRGVAAVEVRVDEGAWEPCELTEPLSDSAWVQWRRSLTLPPGEHRLTVRATDGTGAVQVAERTDPAPDGATGRHAIRVRVA